MPKNSAQIFTTTISSPMGELQLFANERALLGLFMKNNDSYGVPKKFAAAQKEKNKVLILAETELKKYFKNQLSEFTVPIELQGTDFQLSVWKELCLIRKGQLRSYVDHAKNISKPKAIRAVGAAIGKNPISIIVPCHRVIGKNSSLTGYAGGLSAKEWLLKHEGFIIKGQTLIK